jgi:uncharacterized protein YebE (UPF0316 family)
MMMEYLTMSAGIFFLMQFINVVLSTMKTILTVKANKHVAMLINTVTYTFYSGVVKLLTEQPMVIVLAVTFLTNMIGVYLALYILEKTRKDVLWKVEVTVQNEVAEELHNRMTDVPHSYIEVGKNTLFNFYCDTQKESAKVKEVVKHYNAKYFVAESKAL